MTAKAARTKDPTTVVRETLVGECAASLESAVKAASAAALVRFPNKLIEREGDLSEEGVRKLKRGESAPSLATLVRLARSRTDLGPAIWGLLQELTGRGAPEQFDSPRLNSLFGALHVVARSKGPEGAFAAAIVAAMNADAAPVEPEGERESAAIYDLFEGRRR